MLAGVPCLFSFLLERIAYRQGHRTETALLLQAGIGVAMHGCVRPGLLGRTSPVAASHPLVTVQPAETGRLGHGLAELRETHALAASLPDDL